MVAMAAVVAERALQAAAVAVGAEALINFTAAPAGTSSRGVSVTKV